MAYILLIIIMTKMCITYSFLMTNSTVSRLCSFEYQHLSQLIYNGESRIATLEQELMTVNTIHDQAISDMDLRYKKIEQQLNVTKAELYATKTDHSVTKAMLQEQVRTSDYIKQALEKEKSNIHQLQQQYTGLMNDFQNFSRSCHGDIASLNQRVKDLESQNLSHNINGNTADLLKRLEIVERLQTNVSILTALAKISVLDANMSNIATDISSCNNNILQLQNRTG